MQADPISVAAPFAEVARAYTQLVESLPGISREQLLVGCLRILPELFSASLDLEDAENGDPATLPDSPQYMSLLVEVLGEVDPYLMVFSPYNDLPALEPPFDNGEVLVNSLADDLADIYTDIKPGVDAYYSEDRIAQEHAVSQWYYGFIGGDHTARHLLSALPPLYAQSVNLLALAKYGVQE
jgi:hypothetical protein